MEVQYIWKYRHRDDFIRLDLKKYECLAVQGVNNSFDTVFGHMFLSFGCESPFGVVTKPSGVSILQEHVAVKDGSEGLNLRVSFLNMNFCDLFK